MMIKQILVFIFIVLVYSSCRTQKYINISPSSIQFYEHYQCFGNDSTNSEQNISLYYLLKGQIKDSMKVGKWEWYFGNNCKWQKKSIYHFRNDVFISGKDFDENGRVKKRIKRIGDFKYEITTKNKDTSIVRIVTGNFSLPINYNDELIIE